MLGLWSFVSCLKVFHIPFNLFCMKNSTNVQYSVWRFPMLYHLTDILVKTSWNYHFCPIVIPLKVAFTYSANIISIKYLQWKLKFEEPTKGKMVKCDWMNLFNTTKKIQINWGVDEWQSFQKSCYFRVLFKTCELPTYKKKWTVKCMLSWLLYGSCTCREVR